MHSNSANCRNTFLPIAQNGEPIEVPQYDFTKHKRTEATTRVEAADVVIVDGIFTLYVEQVR